MPRTKPKEKTCKSRSTIQISKSVTQTTRAVERAEVRGVEAERRKDSTEEDMRSYLHGAQAAVTLPR